MKKLISAVAAVLCVAVCCFTACDFETDRYGELNSKLNLNYSAINLTVTDKYDENTSLRSDYYMEFSDDIVNVTYSLERFADISLDGSSSDVKTTISGETVIKLKNGVAVSEDKNILSVFSGKLNFKKEYFENAELNQSSFKADVKNANGFFDTEITCTDMKVSAFFDDAFQSITVTYTAESGNSVEYRYIFGDLA